MSHLNSLCSCEILTLSAFPSLICPRNSVTLFQCSPCLRESTRYSRTARNPPSLSSSVRTTSRSSSTSRPDSSLGNGFFKVWLHLLSVVVAAAATTTNNNINTTAAATTTTTTTTNFCYSSSNNDKHMLNLVSLMAASHSVSSPSRCPLGGPQLPERPEPCQKKSIVLFLDYHSNRR